MTPDSIKLGPQPEPAQWPHPGNAPKPSRKGELILTVVVTSITLDDEALLAHVEATTVDGGGQAHWITRPAPGLGTPYWIFRFGNGEVCAVGADGDQHQLKDMSVGTPPTRQEPPFPPAPPYIVEEATRRAEELGLRLDFRRTGVMVTSARGEIEQPFIETWENTLVLVGLGTSWPS